MTTAPISKVNLWRAEQRVHAVAEDARLSPCAVDDQWVPLQQAWRPEGLESGFNPGWARIQHSPSALHFDVIFLGPKPSNRAVRLNDPTWEMGDVCEIFLQSGAQQRYVEIHITPENQRLQLEWPVDGLARWRRGEARFEEFTVTRADWVQSLSWPGPGFWTTQLTLPFSSLRLESRETRGDLRVAVCRYDYSRGTDFILSSTAFLSEPNYHRTDEWHRLQLAP